MQDQGQDMQEELVHFGLTKMILKCCFEVMNTLGTGFLESIYKNSLLIAMIDSGLKVSTDRGFEVIFHGRKVGIFIPDLIVENAVIVELKSCEHLLAEHQTQLINYLAVTNVQVGLLVNFGKRKLEYKRLHHPVYHATYDLANHVPI
jgi:GxxExxY protein